MLRVFVVASASIGMILLVTFIASRVVRSRRRGMSIRLQVFIALASIVGAFAFGLGLMVIDRIEARANRFAKGAAEDKAQVIAKLVGGELERQHHGLMSLARALSDGGPDYDLLGVEILGPGNQLLYRSEQGFPSTNARWVSAEAAIFANNVLQGRVRVVKATLRTEQLLADFAPTVLVISLVLGAAAALAAAWIGRTIAGPIEALSAYSKDVSAGRQRAVPPVPHGREVTRLTEALDSMRRQLEGRPFAETFAADLSHELKNPVAAIRASAEVLEEGALDEPEQARLFVARIREAVARIERMVGELLGLARIESRGVEGFEPVDLNALARQTAGHCSEPTRVQVQGEGPLWVRGHSAWLARALENLLENAVIHSEKGTPITVRLVQDASDVQVDVRNRGKVPKHSESRLFVRFFTTRENKGGTGLGLPIVRAVAEAHRGEIQLLDAGPPDVTFRLTLPRA